MSKFVLLFVLLFMQGGEARLSANELTFFVDGHRVQPAISFVYEGEVFVHARPVLEAAGVIVDFQSIQGRLMALRNGSLAVMYVGGNHLYINDDIVPITNPPQMIDNFFVVPIAPLAEALGLTFSHEGSLVFINTYEQPDTAYQGTDGSPYIEQPTYDLNDLNDFNYAHYIDQWFFDFDEYNDIRDYSFGRFSIDISHEFIHERQEHGIHFHVTQGAFPPTNITDISWNRGLTEFTITADSEISDARWELMEDGRLVVDILNAFGDLPQYNFDVYNGFITTIRTGQHIDDVTGLPMVRLVFDTTMPTIFSVALSQNRDMLFVDFHANELTTLRYYDYGNREALHFTGLIPHGIEASFIHGPLRLVFDLPNATLGDMLQLGFNPDDIAPGGLGRFVQDIRFSQFDEHTVRVVLDLAELVGYNIIFRDNKTIIYITPPSFSNIQYNHAQGRLELLLPEGLNIDNIGLGDYYLRNLYNLYLGADFSEHFGYGRVNINGGLMRYMYIATVGGETVLSMQSRQILAYRLNQVGEYLHIYPTHPRDFYDFVLLLDPGHGGRDPGAVHFGMREADFNLDVSFMMRDLLIADGRVRVYMTRHEDVTVPNAQRARIANETADIFVSIHANAANGRAMGTEVLYTITEREADARRPLNSRGLARLFQDNLVAALGSNDRGLRDRPQILILNQSHIPTILVEVGFMDAQPEAARLADPAYRRLAAEAMVEAIFEAMDILGR